MNVLYEEDGSFKTGRVLADQGGALQVESSTGKRSKVKTAHVLLEFREPEPAALLHAANDLAEQIELDFLWECAPTDEFGFADMGEDYFGHKPSPIEATALALRLHGAPMYFYRKGRGRYKSAPADALKAALASVERKRLQVVRQAEYAETLKARRLPEAFRGKVPELLFKPYKNGIEYKALEEASAALATTPARLMLQTGGLASEKELHRQRFLFAAFPDGIAFPEIAAPAGPDDAIADLPLAPVSAFSVDDHTTTEIDDAFSVQAIESPPESAERTARYRIGIHIAAPGLAIRPGDAVDAIARERFSTVYTPGEKITMLPPAIVDAYTLAAGRDRPALSLYVEVEVGKPAEADSGAGSHAEEWTVVKTESRVERVPIAHNLRHNDLDDLITEDSLASGAGDYPVKAELGVLWRFARSLYAKRQAARVASGLRPELNNRADYNFYVDERDGVEKVEIVQRKRGAPLDTLVAEMMILANSTWGKLLADCGVAGIYRVQNAGYGPAARVRMVTHAAPHAGLGVAQYAWSSSPLRRYVDLVNQWQLLACLEGAPPPFKKNDSELFSIVSGFDTAYAAYAEIQATMERYWCLRWLLQHGLRVTEALVQRDDTVRLPDIPLQLRVPGLLGLTQPLARGTRVEIELTAIDLVDLSAECRLLAIIEEVDTADEEVDVGDEEVDALADVGAEEEVAEAVAGVAPGVAV